MNDQPPLPPPIPPAARPPRQPSLIITLLIAGGIFFLDTEMQSMPLASMVTLTVVNVFLLGGLLVAWGKGAPLRRRILRIAILSAAALAAWGSIQRDRQRTQENAHEVVAAVERFKTAERRYPDRLEELVPRYLPEIPPVERGIYARRVGFRYYFTRHSTSTNGYDVNPHHVLEYVSATPFGKTYYDFEAGAWGFRD